VATKKTFSFGSRFSPALARFSSGNSLAWTGLGGGLNVAGLPSNIGELLEPPPAGRRPNFKKYLRTGLETETSIGAPDLAPFNGRLYVAWAGTDGSGHLNVISSSDGESWDPATKRTLPELSASGATLHPFGNQLFLAWTGVDGAGSVNLMSSTDGLNFGGKEVLPGAHSIDAAPSLCVVTDPSGSGSRLYVGWTDRGTNKLQIVLRQPNGQGAFDYPHEGFFGAIGDDIQSEAAPCLIGGFSLGVGWIGSGQHINTAFLDVWTSPGLGGQWKAQGPFEDTSRVAPAIQRSGGSTDDIAWAGMDGQSRINVSYSGAMLRV
jgi:hypothetical protein